MVHYCVVAKGQNRAIKYTQLYCTLPHCGAFARILIPPRCAADESVAIARRAHIPGIRLNDPLPFGVTLNSRAPQASRLQKAFKIDTAPSTYRVRQVPPIRHVPQLPSCANAGVARKPAAAVTTTPATTPAASAHRVCDALEPMPVSDSPVAM